MNKNPLNKGVLTENAIGIGTVTPEMVEARARELAVIAGRVPPQPSRVDYEQAKRELTSGPDINIQEAVVESIPESERWEPVPGSSGLHAPESFGEDEDSEGQSESAQLVEEGNRRSRARSDASSSPSSPENGSTRTVNLTMNWIQQRKQSALKNEWQTESFALSRAVFKIFFTPDC